MGMSRITCLRRSNLPGASATANARVTYRGKAIDVNYQEFRHLIGRVIASPLVNSARAAEIGRALAPFDAAFA